jgi:RNA polymerase sigma-70 factor (ECF subfamily)
MTDSRAQDLEIIHRVRQGHRDAFADLVRKYQTRVRGYCRSVLRDAVEAEDAAQEVFLKAYQGLAQFRQQASFSSWLYRITMNQCRDMLRKRSRRPVESLDALLEEAGSAAEALLATPEDAPVSPERVELAGKLLRTLSEEHQSILVLREVQGLSYDELSDVLECSIDAVKGRLKRARQELAKRLRHFLRPSGVQTSRGA